MLSRNPTFLRKPADVHISCIASGVPNTAAASAMCRPKSSMTNRLTMSVRGTIGTCAKIYRFTPMTAMVGCQMVTARGLIYTGLTRMLDDPLAQSASALQAYWHVGMYFASAHFEWPVSCCELSKRRCMHLLLHASLQWGRGYSEISTDEIMWTSSVN